MNLGTGRPSGRPFSFAGLLAFMALILVAPGAAHAADETGTATLSMSPRSGDLYREAPRPVDWRVEVEVKPGPMASSVLPTKFIRAYFPEEMIFDPAPGTAVCPEDQIGPPPVNMTIAPEKMIARCPDALVGNGRAIINVAGTICDLCRLEDPVLLAFNGGKNEKGDAELRIYAYSKAGATGLYEEAVLRDGVLDVAIPQITGDSSTAIFDLNIPGRNTEHPEWNGVDPGFVKTTCSKGSWGGHAELTLGNRDTAGQAIGPDSLVRTPDFTTPCAGLAGQARLGRISVKGPATVKQDRKGTYRVTLSNSGTASIRGGTLKVGGPGVSGKATFGAVAAESTRTVKVRVKFTRKGMVKAGFTVKARGAGSKSVARRIKVT